MATYNTSGKTWINESSQFDADSGNDITSLIAEKLDRDGAIPLTADLSAGGYGLINIGAGGTATISITDTIAALAGKDLTLNAPTGQAIHLQINGVTKASVNSDGIFTVTEDIKSSRSDSLGPFFGAGAAVPLRLGANNTTRIWITSGGDVGVRNATPTEAFDVYGNIAVSGTVDGVDVGLVHGTYVNGKNGSISLTTVYADVVNYTEVVDPQGIFNPTTGVATLSPSGVYFVSASHYSVNLTDHDVVDLDIHVDSANVASTVRNASGDRCGGSVQYIVSGASSVKLQARNSTASRGTLYAYLNIVRIF